jgi:16S rRNA (adenine1518-N6/adenine1519-N6)-dimethyltransferase
MSEIFDVINERDEVIGQATREECHAQRLLHRFVHCYVINSQGLILLQQRKLNKKVSPLKFDAAVGAHVSAGETYLEAVRREAVEEIGVELGEIIDLGGFDHSSQPDSMLGRAFVSWHDGPFSNWEEEAERLEWMTREEIRTLIKRFPYLFVHGMQKSFAALDSYLSGQR